MKKVRKQVTLLLILSIIFVILFQGSAVFAASRFEEILTRFNSIFIHTGRIEHEHTFNYNSGTVAFFAAGIGSASGVHAAWTITSKSDTPPGDPVLNAYNYISSYAYFFGTTARDALPGQYMRIISGSSYGTAHNNLVGVMPKPGEKGYVHETLSVANDKKDGKNYGYFRHSSGAGTSDGITRISKETNGSTTTVNVDGYSQILESYIEDSGGSKVGWWSLP